MRPVLAPFVKGVGGFNPAASTESLPGDVRIQCQYPEYISGNNYYGIVSSRQAFFSPLREGPVPQRFLLQVDWGIRSRRINRGPAV
jgi:hypothetical protein